MPSVIPPRNSKGRRTFSLRRAALLATTIAGLGTAAFVVAPDVSSFGSYPAAFAQNLSEQAHKLQAPVGFADIVEKVKPRSEEHTSELQSPYAVSSAGFCS